MLERGGPGGVSSCINNIWTHTLEQYKYINRVVTSAFVMKHITEINCNRTNHVNGDWVRLMVRCWHTPSSSQDYSIKLEV